MAVELGTGALPAPWPTSGLRGAPDLTGDPPKRLVIPRWMFLLIVLVAQAMVARAMITAPIVGVVELAAVTALALWAAMKRATTVSLCLIAYIPGMEISLRQNHVPVPYFAAPYLLILISVLAVFTVFNHLTRPGRTVLLYLALLLPSMLVTISVTGADAREPIVFALAGPASLATLIIFFSQVKLDPWLYRRVLWVFLVSGIAPIAIAATSISEYVAIEGSIPFDNESNFATSGGFGPVQVSSVMGLSVVIGVLATMAERQLTTRLLALALTILAAIMSFLTFSRGGMTAAGLAIAALVIANPGSRIPRRRLVAIVGSVLIVGYLFILPWLNNFTNGGFEARFSDTQTGRTELAASDLEVFRNNAAFGVGPGMSKYQRLTWEICQIRTDRCKNEGSSHTEFTRMLAEHGVPGIVAMVFLALLPFQAYQRAGPSRAITLTFLVWAIAQMFYANFRVSAVAVAFAFAFIRVDLDAPESMEPIESGDERRAPPDDATDAPDLVLG